MADFLERVQSAVARLEKRDPKLAKELKSVRERREADPETKRISKAVETAFEGRVAVDPPRVMETIVLRTGRPVLAVQRDEALLEFRDADSEIWRQRLIDARSRLIPAIRAIGRIELEGHRYFEWVGTGWLVAPDVIVTNRHVASEFGRASGRRFVFKSGIGGPMKASIDFLEEFQRADSLDFDVVEILHIEGEEGPDLALLRVQSRNDRKLAEPIRLSRANHPTDRMVAVIGYPARDSRIPDQSLMEQIFGNVYDKKRLAPGLITGVSDGTVEHDCSTLGGNSGSAVIDLETGEAVALHFAGRFLVTNFAVPSGDVADRLDDVTESPRRARRADTTGNGAPARAPRADAVFLPSGTDSTRATQHVSFPIHVTVEVGTPVLGGPRGAGAASAPALDDEVVITEAPPIDYSRRHGYDAEFLGDGAAVPLPDPERDPDDVLTFEVGAETESVLKYQNFSLQMSRSRRLCLYSAVNIDGKQSRKMARRSWHLDSRIPREAQISKECYGNEPKFSRGHMTRREDPIWGTRSLAALGNEDSMHVTNAVPQMQPFNAGIWLGLEDYALENAREDDMRISVITGPFLFENDPVRYGVKIPRSFWKVIAFIHDQTELLSATGYTMSQEDYLADQEFVYGQYATPAHQTTQVPIRSIEQKTGLSFGNLSAIDPLNQVDEARVRPLTDFTEIRF